MALDFYLFLSILLCLYLTVGTLIVLRRDRRQISSRSPWLLLISHIGNMCEGISLLLQEAGTTNVLFPALQVFFHFLYYLPYLLRGYRLYFVFHTDLGSSKSRVDADFLTHIRRSKQIWLLKVLGILMLPVTVWCILISAIPILQTRVPKTVSDNHTYQAIYIAVSFIEEMLFLMCVYSLRRVDEEYSMNRELSVVCVLWYPNTLFSYHSAFTFWTYELLGRNALIMCVSSLWPLIKSYRKPELKELLTLQSLYSLPILLQNEVPFEYFEYFLRFGSFRHNSESANYDQLNAAGEEILNLYIKLLVYKDDPSCEEAEKLITDLNDFNNLFNVLPLSLLTEAEINASASDPGGVALDVVEEYLYNLLLTHYFPLFQKSALFGQLCKFVEQSELQASRIKNTSLCGSSYLSNRNV